MGVVTFEARVGREFTVVGENVFAGIDLREIGRARLEKAVAQLAQVAAAVDRHLGHHLSLLEVNVEGDGAVARLALN